MKLTRNVMDMTGQKWGRLLVLKRNGSLRKLAAWLCRCDCGAEKVIIGAKIRNGLVRSCGCRVGGAARERMFRHGACKTREYRSWSAAKTRVGNVLGKAWKNYGGRGIRMCDRWMYSFELFLADMGPCAAGHTLDRIDPNGDYEPGNCRWASRFTQSNNRRNNRTLTLNGETHSIAVWGRLTGLGREAIRGRLASGWSIERALTQPLDPRFSKKHA